MNQIEMIPVEQILPHPENPRKELGDLTELTESIRANGILQNLTVVSADQVAFLRVPDPQKVWYAAVIGHRRLAAAKAAGLEEVPCVVAGMDRKTQLTTMLMENVQRSDLTVYEQAQGFHQLALLGCPVAEISRRSGFSGTTVRRRLKLAQLDQRKFKAASGRQISMQDYERLLQLKTKEEQDRVLDFIGTRDFGSELERARIREAAAERMPELTAWLEEHGAVQITRSESWTSRYEHLMEKNGGVFTGLQIDRLGKPGSVLPPDQVIAGRALFYVIDEYRIGFYVKPEKKEKAKPEKDPKVVERDRRIREAWNRLEELQRFYQDQHMFFLEERICAAKQAEKLLNGALYVMVGRHFFGFYQDGREIIEKALDIGETNAYSKERQELVMKRLEDCGDIRVPELIYGFFGALTFAASSKAEWPKPCGFKEREQLRYRWLRELGYEVSTEEETLLDGTHEVFREDGPFVRKTAGGAGEE